jgi:hypothetical protein
MSKQYDLVAIGSGTAASVRHPGAALRGGRSRLSITHLLAAHARYAAAIRYTSI